MIYAEVKYFYSQGIFSVGDWLDCLRNSDVLMMKEKIFCSRCGRELVGGYHLLVTDSGTRRPVCKDDRMCFRNVYLPNKVKKIKSRYHSFNYPIGRR